MHVARKPLFSRGFLLVAATLTAFLTVADGVAETPASEPAAADSTAVESPRPREVVHLRLKSIIHPVAQQYVEEGIAEAERIDAVAVVLELDTPGGLLTSTRGIFSRMLDSSVPIVVYVSPAGAQAASAGFFLLMAADVAAMTPGSNTGAAHPVGGSGEDIEGAMGEKVEQDAAASIRSLATRNGRNVELAEAAVLESRSFSAEEALEQGLIDVIAEDVEALLLAVDGFELTKLAGEGADGEARVAVLETADTVLRERSMTPVQRLLSVIADPNIAYLLLSLGGLGIYFELSNPGAILPGVVGLICLVLAFFALSVLPTNYAGIALVMLSILFFIAEVKVVSFGLLTVAGVVCLALGSSMLFKSFDPALQVSRDVVIGVVAFALVTVGLLTTLVVRTRRSQVATGIEGLVSERGVARTDLAPDGKVFVHGEIWNARSSHEVSSGQKVRVVAVDGMTLQVEAEA